MKKLYIIAVSIVFLSGCASEKELQMGYTAQLEAVKAQAAVEQKPTLEVKCGEGDSACKGLDLSYTDPRDRNKIVIPRVTNSNDTLIGFGGKVVDGVTTIGKWGLGVYGVKTIADSMNRGGTNINNNVSGENNTLTSDVATHDGSQDIVDSNNANDNQHDSNNNANENTADSNNDSSDQSDNSDNSDNSAVADPTIVDGTSTIETTNTTNTTNTTDTSDTDTTTTTTTTNP